MRISLEGGYLLALGIVGRREECMYRPLMDAQVLLISAATQTGHSLISGLPPGPYESPFHAYFIWKPITSKSICLSLENYAKNAVRRLLSEATSTFTLPYILNS